MNETVDDIIAMHDLKSRKIYLWGDIEENLAGSFVAQLNYYLDKDATKPVYLLIHSDGGCMDAMHTILDEMKAAKDIKVPIYTIVTGKAYSAAAIILAQGSKGCRLARPRASIMFHPVSYGNPSDYAAFQEKYNEFSKISINSLNNDICESVGLEDDKSKAKFIRNMAHSLWLKPDKALALNVIDKIYGGVINYDNLK